MSVELVPIPASRTELASAELVRLAEAAQRYDYPRRRNNHDMKEPVIHATDRVRLHQKTIATVCGKRVRPDGVVEDLWGAVTCPSCKAILRDRLRGRQQPKHRARAAK